MKRNKGEFPILEHNYRSEGAPYTGPKSVPWWFLTRLDRFEEQARANHDQSLERLAERGGLGASEMVAVIRGVPLRAVRNMDRNVAGRIIEEDLRVAIEAHWGQQTDAAFKFLIQLCTITTIAAIKQSGVDQVTQENPDWLSSEEWKELGKLIKAPPQAPEWLRKAVLGELSERFCALSPCVKGEYTEHPGYTWMREHIEELKSYAGQHIAVNEDGICAAAVTMEELVILLNAHGTENALISYIPPPNFITVELGSI